MKTYKELVAEYLETRKFASKKPGIQRKIKIAAENYAKRNYVAPEPVYENDEENPNYIFRCINTNLLTQALAGEIDLEELAKKELAARGLDEAGKWVGFEQAKKIHFPNKKHNIYL